MKPKYPLYIVSKGRWESRLTAKALEEIGLPYYIVVEHQEYEHYASVIDEAKDLYDTCDKLGDSKSKGPGAARNFAWQHSVDSGYRWHWVMDDNITNFQRLNRNTKIKMRTGAGFRAMEDFCERYSNVLMGGPNYDFFAKRKQKIPQFIINTRIYY